MTKVWLPAPFWAARLGRYPSRKDIPAVSRSDWSRSWGRPGSPSKLQKGGEPKARGPRYRPPYYREPKRVSATELNAWAARAAAEAQARKEADPRAHLRRLRDRPHVYRSGASAAAERVFSSAIQRAAALARGEAVAIGRGTPFYSPSALAAIRAWHAVRQREAPDTGPLFVSGVMLNDPATGEPWSAMSLPDAGEAFGRAVRRVTGETGDETDG